MYPVVVVQRGTLVHVEADSVHFILLEPMRPLVESELDVRPSHPPPPPLPSQALEEQRAGYAR